MKYNFLYFLFIVLLFYSCSYKDREYNLEFQNDYLEWMPDESTTEMVYSDTNGNTIVYQLNYYDDGTNLVYIDGDEGVNYYYFGKWKSINYSNTEDENPILEYTYYIAYQYERQVDMLNVQYGSFSMKIAIPDEAYYIEDNYSDYSNYLFADTMQINGQMFESVYYRESLSGDVGIYYKKNTIIAFKSGSGTYLIKQ